MANPQPSDAHLRVAHSINEAIMMRDFSKRQRKILDLILRLSWGCNKKHALIPRQRDFQTVGIGEGHIKVELVWLAQSQIITIEDDKYSFNKDFDQWQVSRVRPFTPEKLTELVRLNLNGNMPQLTETVRNNLSKLTERVSPPYRKGKFATSELALPKESLKKELKKDIYTPPQKDFTTFWLAYPKRKSKGAAEKAFKNVNPDKELMLIILTAIERANQSADWLKADGQYIPYPATWLNAKGWEDEIKKGGQDGQRGRYPQERGLPTTYKTPEEHFKAKDAR